LTFDLLIPDYDILQAIPNIIRALPIQIKVFHVKGHQDHTKQWDELDPYAQINVLLADEQAETVYSKATGQAGIFHM
jgi:hypothetical protein